MMKQMYFWDTETQACNTDTFDPIRIDDVTVTKKELLKNMRELRKMGFVRMYRGGINEEGEVVGGTYFELDKLSYENIKELRDMLTNSPTKE